MLRARLPVCKRPSLRRRERGGGDEDGHHRQQQRALRPPAAATLNRLQNGIGHRLERSGGEFSPWIHRLYTSAVELRDLPSVDELAADGRLATAAPRPLLVAAARSALARAREEIRAGADPGDLVDRVESELGAARAARLRRVINATGVIVHTNLGRAPLAHDALERVAMVAAGY